MGSKKIKWDKSSILNKIKDSFNVNKYDFYDIIHRGADNSAFFEFELTNPGATLEFTASIECWDNGSEYEVDDISISNLIVIDDDSNYHHPVSPAEIEKALKKINFNL